MSVHDETWDKCPKCGQTIKSWHGEYHSKGFCMNFTFEEYENSPKQRVYTNSLIHQNKILRAALEGKRVVSRPLDQPYWPHKEVSKGHNFDFNKYDYEIKEEKYEPSIAYFIPNSTETWDAFGETGESAEGHWDFKGVHNLSFHEPNKFILLDDKVKKALDSANIKYD